MMITNESLRPILMCTTSSSGVYTAIFWHPKTHLLMVNDFNTSFSNEKNLSLCFFTAGKTVHPTCGTNL
jgi:hypothetical protein